MTRFLALVATAAAALLLSPVTHSDASKLDAVRAGFAKPPLDARVMMRWWWFGPSVEKAELQRELETMRAGGIGGAEVQPVYPLEPDESGGGLHNFAYLSPEFLDALGFAAETGRKLGMRMSVTLGSGWPYGGAHVPVTEAAGQLRVIAIGAPPGAASLSVPAIRSGEQLLAAFLVRGTPDHYETAPARQVAEIRDGRLMLPVGTAGPQSVIFFASGRTGQQVKRAAVGAEGFVLDHFSRTAVQDHLTTVAEPLLHAFGEHPPYSVFSDSLEVYGADWTPDFLQQFQRRRGYDLTPHLLQIAAGTDAQAADLRYDWGRTLSELIDENYLSPINDWARAHGTQFRSQTYGTPAVTLSSNRRVDLPEGEGADWHDFSYTRWATSAGHLYGRPIISAEAWTSLHGAPFRATPLDIKAAADSFFLQGINQLIGHGWPYSPPSAGEPGWAFYAAAVFSEHNPWWSVMPDMTAYLQRISFLLRSGAPANDVAILLPTADAQARFRPGHVSVTDELRTLLGPDLIGAVVDAGYGFDFIDTQAIMQTGICYPVLIMPGIERIPFDAYQKIHEYRRRGGIVIATNSLPSRAPGLLDSARDSAAVRRISATLAKGARGGATLVADAGRLGEALRGLLRPDVAISPRTPSIGFIHRKLEDADIYFVANTDNQPHAVAAEFRTKWTRAECWNPDTGGTTDTGCRRSGRLSLAPYESRVLVFTEKTPARVAPPVDLPAAAAMSGPGTVLDLNQDWDVTYDKTGRTDHWPLLHSWSDDDATKFYSGTVSFERTVQITESWLKGGSVVLDFGAGTPVERPSERRYPSRAWLESPVREAAVVYVNGARAGSVWHPPYTLDLRAWLRAGSNRLKIVVANTAMNELSGKAPADYRLLNLRYGERFTPWDRDPPAALPSGILGPLRLEAGVP
jgi:alpha-L-rhamnosidase